MISFCTENDELNSDDLFGILIVGFQSRKIIEHIFSSKEVLVQEDFFNNFDNFGEFRHRSSTAKQDQEFDFFSGRQIHDLYSAICKGKNFHIKGTINMEKCQEKLKL